MTTQFDNITTDRPSLKAWEAVRTIASVVIAVALLTIATGGILSESPDVPDHSLRRSSVPAPVQLSAREPPEPVADVFFLVRTPEEAYLADLGAWDRLSEGSYRYYEVLYARNDAELEDAGESILDHILVSGTRPWIQVIDLRGIKADARGN